MRRKQRWASAILLGILLPVVSVMVSACKTSGGDSEEELPPDATRNPSLYAFTLQNEGSGFFQQGRYEAALERFMKAESIQPGNAAVQNMIGLCYMRMNQLDQALAAFNQALTLAPAFTNARNNRGTAYLSMKQYQMAEIDFAAVLADSTYPHRWQAFYNLGMTYLQRGQLAPAEENLRRAATAPVPVFDAFLRLAEIARERRQDKVALDWLERARLRFPDRIEAAMELGIQLIEQGRENEARRHLQLVIETDPGSDMAARARVLLEACGEH